MTLDNHLINHCHKSSFLHFLELKVRIFATMIISAEKLQSNVVHSHHHRILIYFVVIDDVSS